MPDQFTRKPYKAVTEWISQYGPSEWNDITVGQHWEGVILSWETQSALASQRAKGFLICSP